ncbi:MAG: hypothetical protein LWX51_07340 [Deltaproteobacteria bacterium]|nr:hypothetical protein [Deltaproteobacteria bacterium]
MKKIKLLLVCMLLSLFFTSYAFAHTPFCSCLDNGDGTILCEGGFLDGSSAVGVRIQVVDANGKILIEGYMDKKSEFRFNKPSGEYTVILDAGFEHYVTVPGSEITE